MPYSDDGVRAHVLCLLDRHLDELVPHLRRQLGQVLELAAADRLEGCADIRLKLMRGRNYILKSILQILDPNPRLTEAINEIRATIEKE